MSRNNPISEYMLAIVFLGMLILAMIGCKCNCIPSEVHTTDSVFVEVRTRDTVITTTADSASLVALVRCDSANRVMIEQLSVLQGERIKANSSAQHTNDGGLLLSFDCKEDSLQHIIHMQDSIINRLKAKIITQQVEVPKDESQFLRNSGIALWVLIALAVVAAIIGIVIKFAK